MKRIEAFCVALVLFVLTSSGLHAGLSKVPWQTEGGCFNRWYSNYKDRSADALKENLDDQTMILFGSSEFGHLKTSPVYPANLFDRKEVDYQLLAQPYEQCLNHAISLGALSADLKSKKVILLLSPTWFEGKGVKEKAFAARFSDSLYLAMLKNPNLSKALKRKIADRTTRLLDADSGKRNRVGLYNARYLDGTKNPVRGLCAGVLGRYYTDKENAALRLEILKQDRLKNSPPKVYAGDRNQKSGDPNWNLLWKQAQERSEHVPDNPMHMEERAWRGEFSLRYNRARGIHQKTSMTKSQEYDDLELFLEICREEGIDARIIVQPINGYWYDHTGLAASEKETFHKKIGEMARTYGAGLDDLGRWDYHPRVLTDAVHPWEKGWLLLDEKIYDFYRREKTAS